MAEHTRAAGDAAEEQACTILERKGYSIQKRNVHMGKLGELDIIAMQGEVTVFVEVRSRRTRSGAEPEETVNFTKLSHLTRAALQYVATGNVHGPWRIDVIALTLDADGQLLDCRHVENVTMG